MKKLTMTMGVVVLATLFVPMLRAQTAGPATAVTHAPGDIAGDWQGTIDPGKETRIVVRIAKADKGWSGKMILLLDQGGQPVDLSAVVLSGSSLKFSANLMGATFEGTVSPDGNSIVGGFSGGPKPMPATLVRATKETAWEIPAPPPPPKVLPADADPSFDVATIKPNPSGAASMQQLTTNGHNFVIRNGSLGDMMSFAYNVQMKQIVNAPAWIDNDRYDIAATQEQDGLASDKQLRGMVRKMLEDRFKLTVHHEKRELPAFVLTVGKNGQKLTPTQIKGPLPGMGFRPTPGGLMLRVNNGTVEDLSDFLQSAVLDRPVVDHTGIAGRFDIGIKFMPDDSQFKGHPPKLPEETDATAAETAPNLFDAIDQQLGLKLSAEKASVDVIAIDHVEKPSPN
jgi:uncharacterized protein (TIGR03435 family)